MNGRQYHWTERKQGQSGGAIGRVELNNFLFTFCGHLTASDNKCVRNPIRIQIRIGKPIQYLLGATSSSKPIGGDILYLAENLKFLREQRGKTQQELAKLFGVEQKTLSSWECGSRTPVIGMIVEMAKYYEVSLDDLVLTDMKPPIPVYALNIAYLRKKYGMTQQELVEIVGLKHKSSISLIEAGKYEPSIEKLEKLADFFGVTMDQIVKQDLSQEVSE